jgi:hypothetical protein
MRIEVFIICFFFFVACENSINTKGIEKAKSMNDSVSGLFSLKYPSGQVKETGMLIKGRKNGIWKSFDENGNLLSAAYYYKNEKVTDIEKEDFIFTKVFCDDICINLPSNWKIKKNYKQALILAVKNASSYTTFTPTINVLQVEIPKGIDFPQFIIATKKDLVNNYQEIKFKEEKELSIAENRGYEILYFVIANNQKLAVLSTYIKKGNSCYIVTCIAEGKGEEYVKYNDLFKEITSSFNFTSSQAN